MPAHYDTYDYATYWQGRDYEHGSEVVALKEFLARIPRIDRFLDLGAGFGRLTPYYVHRSKRVVLADPSARLLKEARKRLHEPNVRIVHTGVENCSKKFKSSSFDAVMVVRVLHHLESIDEVFDTIAKLVKKGGYLILEYPNKLHFKAIAKRILCGDLTFPIEIFPADRSSERSKKTKCLPFYNYHPDDIRTSLERHGFKLVDKRSVSNVRSSWIKKHLPLDFLMKFEKFLQKPLATINFGPSMFILAKRV